MGRRRHHSRDDRVWSEVTRAGVTVHAPGLNLTAPATMPAGVSEQVGRLRAALVFGGTGDPGDLAAVLVAAFGAAQVVAGPFARLPYPVQLLALSHVLKAWGVSVGWH